MFPYKGIICVLRCIIIALITFYAIFKRCADAPHIVVLRVNTNGVMC